MVANSTSSGTPAERRRSGPAAHSSGRWSARSISAWPLAVCQDRNTPIWPWSILPEAPEDRRLTPTLFLPCLIKPVSSMASTASSAPRPPSTTPGCSSRRVCASHAPRPSRCWKRYGLSKPAASAHGQLFLRSTLPGRLCRYAPAVARADGLAKWPPRRCVVSFQSGAKRPLLLLALVRSHELDRIITGL